MRNPRLESSLDQCTSKHKSGFSYGSVQHLQKNFKQGYIFEEQELMSHEQQL